MSIDRLLTRRTFLKTMSIGAAGSAVFGPQIITPKRTHAAQKIEGFNLEAEVARVMEDPRVPDYNPATRNAAGDLVWDIHEYAEVIQTLRNQRLSHTNSDGSSSVLQEQVSVPGMGNLRVEYVSGNLGDKNMDNIDVLYITGTLTGNSLSARVINGNQKLILVAGCSNDQDLGPMDQTQINNLNAALSSPNPKAVIEMLNNPEDDQYRRKLSHIQFNSMDLRGDEQTPILIAGDMPTPFAFHWITFGEGIWDYVLNGHRANMWTVSNNSLIARSKLGNVLESCVNGSGYRIANHLGSTYNECIGIGGFGLDQIHKIHYNFFNNPVGNAITFDDLNATITNNVFKSGRIASYEGYSGQGTLIVKNNDILTLPIAVEARSATDLDFRENYWGTTDPQQIDNRIHDQKDDPSLGKVTYSLSNSTLDYDRDGISDIDEINYDRNPSFNPYNPLTGEGTDLDPRNWDTDLDNFSDGEEIRLGTNPLDRNDFPKVPTTGKLGLAATTIALAAIAVKILYDRRDEIAQEKASNKMS